MKHKLLLIFGVLALLVSVISLIILIVGLEVAPGHQHLVDRQMVNTVKPLIWCFGLVGGSLIGWAITLRVQSRKNLSLLIPSILLILWSIERLFLGIAPEYDSFYGFSAVVAAIIMIVIVTLGGFLAARWLTSRLISGETETVKKVVVIDASPKSRGAVTLLAGIIGVSGAHRFYLGKTRTAVVMLSLSVLFWVFFVSGLAQHNFAGRVGDLLAVLSMLCLAPVGIWALVDFIFAVTGNMKDRGGKPIKNW